MNKDNIKLRIYYKNTPRLSWSLSCCIHEAKGSAARRSQNAIEKNTVIPVLELVPPEEAQSEQLHTEKMVNSANQNEDAKCEAKKVFHESLRLGPSVKVEAQMQSFPRHHYI